MTSRKPRRFQAHPFVGVMAEAGHGLKGTVASRTSLPLAHSRRTAPGNNALAGVR